MSSLPSRIPIGQAPRETARGRSRPGARWREAVLEGATLGVVAALLVGIAVTWYKTTGGGKVEPAATDQAGAKPIARPGSEGEAGESIPASTRARVERPGPAEPSAGVVAGPESDPFAFPFVGGMPEPLPMARRETPRHQGEVRAPASLSMPMPTPTRDGVVGPIPSSSPAVVRQPPPRAVAPVGPRQARREEARRTWPELVDVAPSGPRARPPAPARGPAPEERGEGSRCLVAGRTGEAVVARVVRRVDGRLLVVMPDGSIGWAGEEVASDRPFRPWTMAEAGAELTRHEYEGFQAVSSDHYLVLTEGSTGVARQSADVLEALHRGLSDALREGGLDPRAPEFPLIVVIFRDRESFLAHRPVGSDVRAYYEAYSNRIFLYETSEAEQRAPDLAAVRRSHTVAHEGVHQYLQNTGIQPRLADWPAWLVEGLAEYYAPPGLEPGEARAQFGAANPFHMATLHDLRDPAAMWEHLVQAGPRAVAPGRRRPASWVEMLVAAESLSPTDYALAWALTHYLARERPDQLKAYIQILGRRSPLEERTGREQLEEFTRAFHRDLGAMGGQVDRHLVGLPFVPIAFHAVMIERPAGPGRVAREALVTQSPAMINRLVEEMATGGGPPGRVWTVPCFTRNQARQVATGWLSGVLLPEGATPWAGGPG